MKISALALIVAPILLMFSFYANALNFSFMENSPAFYFSSEDTRIMEASAIKTLDSAKDGQKMSWKNPDTSAWGFFIASSTNRKEGVLCRELEMFTSAKGVTNEASYKMCKMNNEWKIVD